MIKADLTKKQEILALGFTENKGCYYKDIRKTDLGAIAVIIDKKTAEVSINSYVDGKKFMDSVDYEEDEFYGTYTCNDYDEEADPSIIIELCMRNIIYYEKEITNEFNNKQDSNKL